MKLAAVTDDEFSISQHFGRAAYYWVVTIENGVIVSEEKRERPGHTHPAHKEHQAEGHSEGSVDQARHASMIDPVRDCEVILAGGMGSAAFESIRQAGITPILTEVKTIDQAIQWYLAGILEHHQDRLH